MIAKIFELCVFLCSRFFLRNYFLKFCLWVLRILSLKGFSLSLSLSHTHTTTFLIPNFKAQTSEVNKKIKLPCNLISQNLFVFLDGNYYYYFVFPVYIIEILLIVSVVLKKTATLKVRLCYGTAHLFCYLIKTK